MIWQKAWNILQWLWEHVFSWLTDIVLFGSVVFIILYVLIIGSL